MKQSRNMSYTSRFLYFDEMNKLVKCVTGMLRMIKLKILLYITLVSSDIISGEMTFGQLDCKQFQTGWLFLQASWLRALAQNFGEIALARFPSKKTWRTSIAHILTIKSTLFQVQSRTIVLNVEKQTKPCRNMFLHTNK